MVPLARALGVEVDDLLDGGRPIRALSRADWQSLLSFAFALGGGVLFYLLDLFMPMVLCYCAYLGCMAYGVYLQKYYSYHSRWFQIANVLMCLAVNLTFVVKLAVTAAALVLFGASQAMLGASLQGILVSGGAGRLLPLALGVLAAAVLLTAVIQGRCAGGAGGNGFGYSWSVHLSGDFCRDWSPGWRRPSGFSIAYPECLWSSMKGRRNISGSGWPLWRCWGPCPCCDGGIGDGSRLYGACPPCAGA